MGSRVSVVSASLLGAAVSVSLGAWALWPSARIAPTPPSSNDDLEWIAAARDAGSRPAARDLLVANPTGVYLVHARDHVVLRLPNTRGSAARPSQTLARFAGDVAAMALGEGVLCFSVGGGDSKEGATVRELSLSAGPPGRSAVVTSTPAPARAIACDREAVFVVEVDDAVTALTRRSQVIRISARTADGGATREVLAQSDGEITRLAVADEHVYWADSLEGNIVAVGKTGGPSSVLAANRGLPRSIVADGDDLFWVEPRSESLWTMPKRGGAPRTIARDFAGFSDVIANAQGIYWVNEAAVDGGYRVLMVPRQGGDVVAVSPTVETIDALATDGDAVFWARDGDVSALPPPFDRGR